MEEGIQKLSNGQVNPDVFVPTPGYLRRLVDEKLLQPLQHELIPNMEAASGRATPTQARTTT